MRSLSAALEHAMAKKSSKHAGGHARPQHEVSSPHGSLVHPTFPPQAAAQPSSMGSQSAPPGGGDGMGMPMQMPGGMPSMGEEANAYGPGY